jgi:hypothetical protein
VSYTIVRTLSILLTQSILQNRIICYKWCKRAKCRALNRKWMQTKCQWKLGALQKLFYISQWASWSLGLLFSQQLNVQCVPLEGSPGKCWFTSACRACMKCGCHRRKWPPVCSVLTWLVTAVSKNMGPIIRRLSGNGGVPRTVHAGFHYPTNRWFGNSHNRISETTPRR